MSKNTFFRRARILPEKFFLRPASFRPLAALRISVAAILLLQAFLISPEFFEFFGRGGLLQESLQRLFAEPGTPRLAPYLNFMQQWGFNENGALALVGSAYLLALTALMIGLRTHVAAIAAWGLHWTFMSSSSCTNYGVDVFAHIFLFYLMFTPSGRAWSVDSMRCANALRSWTARLSLRVLQIHLCIVYLSSGLEKIVGEQWQTGEVMWRALMLPVYNQYDFTWLAQAPLLAKLMAWGSLVIELGYVAFIWPHVTRKMWVYVTVSLHLGIALFLGLHMFGFMMMAFTAALFGVDAQSVETKTWSLSSRRRFSTYKSGSTVDPCLAHARS